MANTASFRLILLLVALLVTSTTALGGGKVGSRTPIRDVKNNKEIQQLGEYCVQEYNKGGLTKQNHHKGSDSAPLVFVEVVAAEKQVVSGIKYYLKISATTTATAAAGGIKKTFDAEVVVKPWARSKELLNFSPSPPPTPTPTPAT